ncbi:Universal stress protein family protein [Enhygromyxa salina]|uniref:Universal stress protein family protein n=1 Tax=Enhygromyxa salina TaxID=215803 RepID=A0A2S9YAV6_9BACT|nr:universal stress protein [Enhygromyxa salina]PRQ02247.1 Universal stress protein family protein [Enhygromyxa salina]
MSGPLQLTLGLDLRPQTTGAIQYALWLCKAANLQPSGHVQAVHVVEPAAIVELIRHADEPTILGAFKRRGKEICDEVARGAHLHAPEVFGGDVVEILEDRARDHGATALIVSRRASTKAGVAFPRLGSVARRLLRRLKLPILIVPPDLLPSTVGEGPVVVAVDFSESSERALAWARTIADTIGRKLRLVHVADMPDQLGYAGLLQSERWEQLANEIVDRGRERMAEFIKDQGLVDVESTVVRGSVLPMLADFAQTSKACLVVTGSGHHGLLHRVIVPSVASETAAMSTVAVAVVP